MTADPVRAMLRGALRDVLVFVVALTALGAAVGGLVAAAPGVWGGLLGGGVTLLVAGTTVALMLWTAALPVATSAAVALGAWVVKAAVLIVALLALQGTDAVHRGVFGVVVVVGVLGSLVLDIRAATRARVPYVTPPADGPSRGDEHPMG